MQLFSIGLYRLDTDGTVQTDPATGVPLATYTNVDIKVRGLNGSYFEALNWLANFLLIY